MHNKIKKAYEDNFDTIYRYFYFRTLNQQIAEDLTSQTFIAFVDGVRKGKNIDDTRKYLFGIARNIFNAYLRDKYKTNEFCIENIDDFSVFARKEIAETNELSLEARAQRYIEQLPKSQRRVAQLRLIEKYSNKEIVSMLQKDSNYVKTTLRRALRSLERMVETGVVVNEEGGQ